MTEGQTLCEINQTKGVGPQRAMRSRTGGRQYSGSDEVGEKGNRRMADAQLRSLQVEHEVDSPPGPLPVLLPHAFSQVMGTQHSCLVV